MSNNKLFLSLYTVRTKVLEDNNSEFIFFIEALWRKNYNMNYFLEESKE